MKFNRVGMRRALLALTVAFVAALTVPAGVGAKMIGDFNDDGRISLQDVVAFLLYLSGRKQIDEIGQEIQTTPQPVYYLYTDIIGDAEFEPDGTYPPPVDNDNFMDDLITVTLHFGEDFLGGRAAGGFDKDEVYGYFITTDNDVNFFFPFVPDGQYWASAELVIADTCYYARTETFYHAGDTLSTFVDIRPLKVGVNQGCFDLILSSAPDAPPEYVQAGPRLWVNKAVLASVYRGSLWEERSKSKIRAR